MRLKVYQYDGCSTCRKALAYLDSRNAAYEAVPIVERPPSLEELKAALPAVGGDVKRLFNVSGQLYRELGIAAKLKSMSEGEALALLAKHGKLVKRPFVVAGPGTFLVGFKEEEWRKVV